MISAFSALQISALQNVAFTEMLYDFFFFLLYRFLLLQNAHFCFTERCSPFAHSALFY